MGSDIDYDLTKVVEGKMPNTIKDVTASVATEDLFEIQNAKFTATLELVETSFKGDAPTDDLYFVLKDANGNELDCCIEKYLDPYYEELQAIFLSDEFVAGALVKVEGYMYWWDGANPHITSIELGQEDAVYETFMSTEDGEEVEVYGFIISRTTFWNGTNINLAGSQAGEGYYVYEYGCTQEKYYQLPVDLENPGYVRVTGTKASYAGMQEIVDATVEVVETDKVYSPLKLEDFAAINEKVMSSVFYGDFEVVQFTTTDSNVTVAENGAYGYKGDNPTDDLYFDVKDANGNILKCCIETYLDYDSIGGVDYKTNLYNTILGLQIGDKVSLQGFMYWWNGANPHIIQVSVKA
ncbi:MAG: hypothetical protein J6R47_03660 [Acholeplasmatales bacterium]|nr:hypothetical protein [Acholeplasmatales bacterium]